MKKEFDEFIKKLEEEIGGIMVSKKDFENEGWRTKTKKKINKLAKEFKEKLK